MTTDTLAPGRELNEAIAEKVMGWIRYEGDAIPAAHRHENEPEIEHAVWLDRDGRRMACRACGTLPDFSGEYSGVEAVWAVVERLQSLRYRVVIDSGTERGGEGWSVQIEQGRAFYVEEAATPAVAICRAALAALTEP